jgi:tetratricopeptide (TPR) repeat protein
MTLKRARAMDNAVEIGNAAYNLALCHVILGQLDQAEVSLAEAKVAFERSGSIPADVLMLEATVAQRQGNMESSLALADQVLSTSPDEIHRFQGWLLKGVIASEHRDIARARAALAEAEKIRFTEPALLAAKEQLSGRILLLEDNPAGAAAAFDRAAACFQEAKRYRAMAMALRHAGEAYRKAGDTARSENRLLRAQRSLAAQGEQAE